jgi:hypothetical protein
MGPIFGCSPLLIDEKSSKLLDRTKLDELLRQPSNFQYSTGGGTKKERKEKEKKRKEKRRHFNSAKSKFKERPNA